MPAQPYSKFRDRPFGPSDRLVLTYKQRLCTFQAILTVSQNVCGSDFLRAFSSHLRRLPRVSGLWVPTIGCCRSSLGSQKEAPEGRICRGERIHHEGTKSRRKAEHAEASPVGTSCLRVFVVSSPSPVIMKNS